VGINHFENELIMKKITILFILLVSLVDIHAQIVNKGILKIKSSTIVYFGDDYTNESGATHTNDGDLHLEGNLTNDGTVTTTGSATGTTYFNSSATTTQNLNGTSDAAKFYNLTVNNASTDGESLEVADGYNLEVTKDVVITSGQKLRLMGEAQLIQTHTGATNNSGLGHLLKDQDGAQNSYRYNYWSSPVQNDAGIVYNVSTVLKDGSTANQWSPTQVGFTTALDGTNGVPIALSTRWMWKYVDSTVDPYNDQDWVQLFDMNTTTPSFGADINPAQGFIMKGTNSAAAYADSQNYSFEGKPNDGDYTLTISANKEYLVGNPYPSALDADQFINDNIAGTPVIDGTIYYWEHWSTGTHVYTEYGGGYATYNLAGGNLATLHPDFTAGSGSGLVLPKQYIPVGQGFIVRSESTSGGTITFDNGQRIFELEGTNSTQLRSTNMTNGVTRRIRLGYENPDERHRHLLLAFTSGNATNSFDYGYDGQMIDVADDDMFFTMQDNGKNLSYVIQGVGVYNIEAFYPFTIKVATAGEHRIILDATENFDEDIYILDKDTNTTFDIRNNDFTINLEVGEYANRFELVFQPRAPLEVENYLNDLITSFYSDNEIIIQNRQLISITDLQIFNSIGQLVYQNTNQDQLSTNEVHIPFDFAQATYVLKLQAKKGRGTYKFINH
jgi:hypothetical protein